jgi:hypothetical protein
MKRAWFVAVVALVLTGVCFAQSPRQVEVVAEVSLTHQTGTTSGTLYTPEETGMFRVNFYLQCTKGDPGDFQGLTAYVHWTDDNFPEAFHQNVGDQEETSPSSWNFIIKDLVGQPITWEVSANAQDTSKYEVYIALEHIGPKVQ